jgi:hypothetical protein
LQIFMFSTDVSIETFARARSVWLMPVINLQDPQVYS